MSYLKHLVDRELSPFLLEKQKWQRSCLVGLKMAVLEEAQM
jgi:hypothetical protein